MQPRVMSTPERGDAVHFSRGAIETIAREVADGGTALETGGILLGHGREDFTVTVAGGPGPGAIRQPQFFLRDLQHARGLAAIAWDADRSQWIGDWHTHPCGPLHPSDADLQAVMKVLGDSVLRLEAFLVVVVAGHDAGRALYAWRVRLLRDGMHVDPLNVGTDGREAGGSKSTTSNGTFPNSFPD